MPLVEVRLRVPFGRSTLDPPFVAQAALLSQTLFSGTATMSTVDIAAALQTVGGALSAGVDADRLLISGNGLASGLSRILEILADVLRGATYPEDEVTTERARLIDRLQVAQSQPAHLVRVALLRRIYGTHPYAVQTPSIDDVTPLGTPQLAALHAARLHPAEATLVIVGDIDADATLDRAEDALGSWDGAGPDETLPPIPALVTGPDRAGRPARVGAVVDATGAAGGRSDAPGPRRAATGNLVFGGYFSSRWVENIREDKGYTYGPHSVVEHSIAGSSIILSAEVATEVTGRGAAGDLVRAGPAGHPASGGERAGAGPPVRARLAAAGHVDSGRAGRAGDHVRRVRAAPGLPGRARRSAGRRRPGTRWPHAGATYLAPAKAATVVLGDASLVESSLATLSAVERCPVPRCGALTVAA